MTKDDNVIDEVIKIGLILGSIWLGSEILKDLAKKNKGGNNYEAGTQPPNF